jgi:crossover junction endodeoxyribonuclease RuvC
MIKPESDPLPDRLHFIYMHISQIITEFKPTEMAIEQVFLARNADSALKLGQARGVAIVSGMNHGLSVSEYSARQAKLSVVGKGSADKTQVQFMVSKLLGLPEPPQSDAADALGIALCHAFTQQGVQKLGKAHQVPSGQLKVNRKVKRGRVRHLLD